MNIYIWPEVEKCTYSYHSGGGVVVFADTLEEAVNLANSEQGCQIKGHEMPVHVRECADGEKLVFIMPDAGCC